MVFDKMFKNEKGENINIFDVIFESKDYKNYIYTLAEAHAIDLIAKTISKTEIQVYEKDEDGNITENKKDLYWLLNVQPNYIENGTTFMYKLVTKLLTDKKVLILINNDVDKNKLLYVADEFDVSREIFKKKEFKNIKVIDVEGNTISVKKEYNSDNAIYITLDNSDLKLASENFKKNTSKILDVASKSYKRANISKWRLKNPGGQPTMINFETQKPISYEDYKKKITEGLLSDEEAIVMISEVFDLINLNKDNNKNLTEYKDIIKQVGDFVAMIWNIPLDVFYGNKTEKSTGTDDYITFAVDPYFEIIEDSLNIALVGKEYYIKGEFIKYNRYSIKHKDILDSASNIDKLLSSGFSFNDISKILRFPKINEGWANEHYITKNYANVKGGEKDEE